MYRHGGPYRFCDWHRGMPPAAISFPSCEKRYGRKGRRKREIALARGKACRFCLPFIVGPCRKERPSGGASNQYDLNVVPRQISDVWKSISCMASKRAFVGADVPVRPQNGPILCEFAAFPWPTESSAPTFKDGNCLRIRRRLPRKCCFRAGGQRRPPLQWRIVRMLCVCKNA